MFLEFDDRNILVEAVSISASLAKGHAESEFEKYRIVQDRLFESDFDKMVKGIADCEYYIVEEVTLLCAYKCENLHFNAHKSIVRF